MKNENISLIRHSQRGLTLVEIVVVIALLGLLMTVVGGTLFSTFAESKGDVTCLTIKEIERDLQIYKARKNKFPTDLSKLPGEKARTDAWGNEFSYSSSSSCGKDYEVTSMGQDGKKGGSGADSDFSSCTCDSDRE